MSQKKRFVAYYRVSTARQGASGLGLDAQKKAVKDFLAGGSGDLSGEFLEIEAVDATTDLSSRQRCKPAVSTTRDLSLRSSTD